MTARWMTPTDRSVAAPFTSTSFTYGGRSPYAYAVALHDTGKMSDAMQLLTGAQRRHSADRDILQALVTYALEQRDSAAALKWAHALEQAAPEDAALAAQVRELEQRLATP